MVVAVFVLVLLIGEKTVPREVDGAQKPQRHLRTKYGYGTTMHAFVNNGEAGATNGINALV